MLIRRHPSLLLAAALTVLATTAGGVPAAQPAAPVEFPYVSVVPPLDRNVTLGGEVTFAFDAEADHEVEEAGGRLESLDVRISRTTMTAARQSRWTYPDYLQDRRFRWSERDKGNLRDRKRVLLRLSKGQTLCVSARATDTSGNVGPWFGDVCVVRFLDDRALSRRGDVRSERDDRYWQGSATSIGPGGRLLSHTMPGRSIVVLLGEPALNRERYANLQVRGSRSDRRVPLCVPGFSRPRAPGPPPRHSTPGW